MTHLPSANLRVHLPSGEMRVMSVIPTTTLSQILQAMDISHELFEGTEPDALVFVNMGQTAMTNLDMNMLDYNNWYVEKGFISSLYIKHRHETELYDL